MPSNYPRQPNTRDRTLERKAGSLLPKILTATAVAVLAIFSFYKYLSSTKTGAPLPLPRKSPLRRPLSPSLTTIHICTALYALRALKPDHPSRAPMPFEFLYLNPLAAPFHPPRDAAHIGSNNHGAVVEAVTKAGRDNRDILAGPSLLSSGEGGGGGIGAAAERSTKTELALRASWFVTDMLLNDEARLYFLERIQPKLIS
ncbi:hypothetical protein LX36DRAFT_716724 [Colletotrichum falcatum]|nr:hypothetical protein LX36DRAFT_716724 [Colletotrichum falcatum]